MTSQSSLGAGLRTRSVASGAALQIDLGDQFLNYDVSDGLKERVKKLLGEHLEEGHRTFVLNLEKVGLIDSCGVGLLIAAHHQVAAEGGVLAIVGACPFVMKVLRMMRLDKFLALYPNQERALKALVDPV
ncbi:MAG: STAS domain-containing protein [Planctomycetes bacterium]|nr:STAS domain-containing protein [Planctomycetota bacterium]